MNHINGSEKHKHGGDVYTYSDCLDFSANCNPLGTPEAVREAARSAAMFMHQYPEVGCRRLKKAIAEAEKVGEDQVVCGNGAAEVIFSLCRALSPKEALVAAPTFAEYQQALETTGCGVRHHYLKEEEGFCLTERILEDIRTGTDILFLCNPNNPTGLLIDPSLMQRILERCRATGTFLVVDECFLDFVREPEIHTLRGLLGSDPKLFLLKAFTKRYSMAGVRLGYGLCGNRALLDRMEMMVQPWNVSSFAQEAGLAALKETDYVEEGRQVVFREALYLKQKLAGLGYTVFPSEANYIFFRGEEGLFEQLLEEKILIRSCGNYEGLSGQYYRTAVKSHGENKKLVQALEKIRDLKKEAPGRVLTGSNS